MGRLDGAATDLRRSLNLDPARSYVVLDLHAASLRLKVDDRARFTQDVQASGLTGWPEPIVAFYQGNLSAQDLLAAASAASPENRAGSLCEAHYHIGQAALAVGDKAAARDAFQHAVADCPFDFSERGGSIAELARLP